MKTYLVGLFLLFATLLGAQEVQEWITTDQPGVVSSPLTQMAPITTFMVILGSLLKGWSPVDNRHVPPILFVLGALVYMGWTKDWSFQGFVVGAISGSSATGIQSLLQSGQAIKEKTFLEKTPPAA